MKKFSMFLLVLIVGCKSVQTQSDDVPVIAMTKTLCMGTCPDYDISIFPDGKVVLNARQFLELQGNYESQLGEGQLEGLINKFETSGFDSFQRSYKSNRSDLPTTTVTFNYQGKTKKVVDYDGAPAELRGLEQEIHSLIDSLEWKERK